MTSTAFESGVALGTGAGQLTMTSTGFENGVALVTGAGSGIGRAVVLTLLRRGCVRIIAADISVSGLLLTHNQKQTINPGAVVLQVVVDVTDSSSVEAMVQKGIAKFGRIDFSIHCAGILTEIERTHEASQENWDKTMAVNLNGLWLCERAVLRVMRTQEPRVLENGVSTRGAIVNISSTLGLMAGSKVGAYTASKHAVAGLTKVDAIDYAEEHIRVNAVCPGFTRTNLLPDTVWDAVQGKEMTTMVPMKRFGLVEEVANVVLFLASDQASFVTGVMLPVDGGYCCQ